MNIDDSANSYLYLSGGHFTSGNTSNLLPQNIFSPPILADHKFVAPLAAKFYSTSLESSIY